MTSLYLESALEEIQDLLAHAASSQDQQLGSARGVMLGKLSGVSQGVIERHIRGFYSVPEEVYEQCMRARVIQGTVGEEGALIIRFPKGISIEDLPLHMHRYSMRTIAVLQGEGEYQYVDEDKQTRYNIAVSSRDVIRFPQGIVHTFVPTGHTNEDLLVYAIHAPFQRLDDEQVLTISSKEFYESFATRSYRTVIEYLKDVK